MDQVRTCLACGREAPRELLLRFAAAPDGTLLFDAAGKAPGRGLYTCPSAACMNGLPGSPRLKKALGGRKAGIEPATLLEAARDQIGGRVRSLLSLARKSGHLLIGTDESLGALRTGSARFVAVAPDAAGRSRGLSGERCVRLGRVDKLAMGGLVGGGECAAFAILDDGLAASVCRDLLRLDSLLDDVPANGRGGTVSRSARRSRETGR
ncbi:MAG: DUF448 domain-containing protein [Deltaproteobacteria bacterium]|nr:DUF448 domain-containing protein [Deltaproteobacteria bacterium]